MSAIIQGRGDVFGPAGATDGDLAIYNGTSGKILKSLPRTDVIPTGSIVQTKVAFSKSQFSSAAIYPSDNTPPLITEGGAAFSMAIQPRYQNSQLLIVASGCAGQSLSTPAHFVVAIHRADLSEAIATQKGSIDADTYSAGFCIQVPDIPNTLSELTYSLRFGGLGAAHTTYLGRQGSAILFGDTQITTLIVYEIKQ